jgi:aromatic-L-amino-acid decarboxylase
LGRRFRALKLWFVIRDYGISGLQNKLRSHLAWALELKAIIEQENDFELLAPVNFATVCFRFKPENITDEEEINILNEKILNTLNAQGKIYFTHTKLNKKYTLRLVIGQTNTRREHVIKAFELIKKAAYAQV